LLLILYATKKAAKELPSVAFSCLWLCVKVRKAFRFRRGVGDLDLLTLFVRIKCIFGLENKRNKPLQTH
jgi:hypothetical protein